MANINKNQIGYNEALAAGTANSLMVQYKRANAAPMDITEVFTSISAATTYANSGSTSYAGQIIAVAGEGIKTEVFTITSASTLVKLVDEDALRYVSETAGKVDIIKINGSALTIVDKTVDINLTSYASQEWVEEKGYLTSKDIEGVEGTSHIHDNKNILDEISSERVEKWDGANSYADSIYSAATKYTDDKLDILVDGDNGKSIRKIANEELAAKLISSAASESLNSLEEIANWIQSHPEDAASMNAEILKLNESAHTHSNKTILDGISESDISNWDDAFDKRHTHTNKSVIDGINEERVAEWDNALASAKSYAESLATNYDAIGSANKAFSAATADTKSQIEALDLKNSYDVKGAADEAFTAATANTASQIEALKLSDTYEGKGAADTALKAAKTYAEGKANDTLSSAKAYANGLAANYDAVGSAEAALVSAKTYADGLAVNYDAVGSAAQALKDAKEYANGLAVNYDTVGSAEAALASAKTYADTEIAKLKNVYDSKGAADAALSSAKAYANGLASNYDTAGSAEAALASAKKYADDKLVDYAPKSYVTEQIISAMTGGEIELTGYAKVEEVKAQCADTLASAKTHTDNAVSQLSEELNWIPVEGDTETHRVRKWRGPRSAYESIIKGGNIDSWTRYSVIDNINGRNVITEYFGENQIAELTGQLLPVINILKSISDGVAEPYNRYIVGMDGVGYSIYECILADDTLRWYIKPFDYRFGVRVIERGLKNYVYINNVLRTYDDIDAGEF